MITSSTNGRLKEIVRLQTQSKARKESGLFVVEGKKLFLEAPPDQCQAVYLTASFAESLQQNPDDRGLQKKLETLPVEVVEDGIFTRICDTQTPQGILTVVQMPPEQKGVWPDRAASDQAETEPANEDDTAQTWLILEEIRDPGNLGTIIRTAEAAGVTGIYCHAGCADPYQPKVIRATMGSIFRMPIRTNCDLSRVIPALQQQGIHVYATAPGAQLSCRAVPYTSRRAFLLGNEGKGLSPEALALADTTVSIPMQGKVESLNVAIATAILLFSMPFDKG